METRANASGFERRRTERGGALAKTAAYYSTFVVLGLAISIIGPTLPSLAEQTKSSLSRISFLFTALFCGYFAGSLAGGWVYDRVRGNPVMGAAALVLLCTLLAVPTIPLLWVLSAVLAVFGFAEGMVDVGGNVLLVWVHGSKVGPFMNGLHFSFGVGAFIAPLVAAQVLRTTGGIRWAYWLLGLLILPVAASLFLFSSPPLRRGGEGGPRRNDPLLVGLIALLFFMHIGGELSFGGWIFTYASRMGLAGQTASALLTSAFWGSLTLGRLLGVPIVTMVKPKTILIAAFGGAVAALGVILAGPRSQAALWGGTVLMGLSIASMVPMCFTFAGGCLDMSGKVASWFMVGGSVGTMVIPWLIGQLFESAGPLVTMRILFVDFSAALVLFLVVLRYAGRRACT